MLADKNHAVSVFINDSSVSTSREEQREGVRVVRFNPSATRSSAFLGHTTNISYEFAAILKQYIAKEGKPDIIEAQEYLGIAYYLLQFKKLLYDWCKDVPVVITMHSPSFLYMEYNQVPEYKYPNYWICEMERFCLQAADLLISPSDFIYDELQKRFSLTNKNIVKIANPFVSRTKDSLSTGGTDHQDGEIIFFGKLTAQKGAFKLLAYFKRLWDEGFTRALTVIGGQDIIYQAEGISMGDLVRGDYKKYIDAGLLVLEKPVKPADVGNRLSSAAVVIVPSMNDNLPYVVFEMMALGKVLLVSRQGGQAEVIENNKTGFIFDHEKPETFSQQLHHILQLTTDQRKQVSDAAIEKVEKAYGPDTIYEQKNAALANILKQPLAPGKAFPFIRPLNREAMVPADGPFSNDLLSIVVPYYNMGIYIDDTIRSIQESDFPNKEIILVNDGSTDPLSIAKLEHYRNQKGIRIISGPNRGLAQTRNTGAEQATGHWLAFLDADDTIVSHYYSNAIRVLRQYENVDFVGCWTRYFGNSKKVWPAFSPEPPVILYHNMVNSSALVYKRQSFLAGGKNDFGMAFQGLEDYDSVISMLSKGYRAVVLPEILFNYRIRPDSMIRHISKSKKLLLSQYMSQKYKNFYGTFAADIFNLLNANGPGIVIDNPTLDYDLSEKLPFGGIFSAKFISIIKRNRHAKAIAYKIYRLIKQ
jgi:glycosyltransferase involved in cell wall biosynthesis